MEDVHTIADLHLLNLGGGGAGTKIRPPLSQKGILTLLYCRHYHKLLHNCEFMNFLDFTNVGTILCSIEFRGTLQKTPAHISPYKTGYLRAPTILCSCRKWWPTNMKSRLHLINDGFIIRREGPPSSLALSMPSIKFVTVLLFLILHCCCSELYLHFHSIFIYFLNPVRACQALSANGLLIICGRL